MPKVVLLLLLKRFVGAVHVSSVVILPSSIIALLVCCCVGCTVDCGCTSASEGFLCAFDCCCCFSEGFEPDFGNGVQRFAYRAVSGSLFFCIVNQDDFNIDCGSLCAILNAIQPIGKSNGS